MTLQECRECGQKISSEAPTCPSCGCPQATAKKPSVALEKKRSFHGWIAVAAILMSSFIPAILAPFFVFAAIVFAALEIGQGGKAFGGVLFVVCGLQAWAVADHFGHLSGSLGITTPREIEEDAVKKYSAINSSIPANASQIIEESCANEWPSDFRMRAYCAGQQREGIAALNRGRPDTVGSNAFIVIRGHCAQEWPRDFKMRAYCESQQYDGYTALQQSGSNQSVKGGCAQQWPDDYRMRVYCESHQQ